MTEGKITKGRMRSAIDVRCNCKQHGSFLHGVYFPIPTSRLEDSMGIEKFKCDKCGNVASISVKEVDDGL